MPRKRKPARLFRKPGELTDPQREHLLFGQPILNYHPDDDFRAESDMQAGWIANRDGLMREYAAAHPGERCWAWWHFTLKRDKPREWYEEYRELDRLHQVDRAEEIAFERMRHLVSWDIGDVEGSARGAISNMKTTYFGLPGCDPGMHGARRHLAELQFRREWHEARGRADLTRFYQLCIAGLRELLGGARLLEMKPKGETQSE